MASVKIPGYRHHFADEFNEEYNHQNAKKTRGRLKINIEFIQDRYKRCMTFTKRRAGLMKKAYQLATLTGSQILLVVASETGHIHTYSTAAFEPILNSQPGRKLISTCLSQPNEQENIMENKIEHNTQNFVNGRIEAISEEEVSGEEEIFELEECLDLQDHRNHTSSHTEQSRLNQSQRQLPVDWPATSGISTSTEYIHQNQQNHLSLRETSVRICERPSIRRLISCPQGSHRENHREMPSNITSSDEYYFQSLGGRQSQVTDSSSSTRRPKWRPQEFNATPNLTRNDEDFDQSTFCLNSSRTSVRYDGRKRTYFQSDPCAEQNYLKVSDDEQPFQAVTQSDFS